MILPGKHLRQDRALLGIGARILSHLNEDRTVSELWARIHNERKQEIEDRQRKAVGSNKLSSNKLVPISYDWFILTMCFLYAISAIDFANGVVSRRGQC